MTKHLSAHTSIRVRWISRSADVPSLNRLPPMASISSMKMMHGWCSRAYPAHYIFCLVLTLWLDTKILRGGESGRGCPWKRSCSEYKTKFLLWPDTNFSLAGRRFHAIRCPGIYKDKYADKGIPNISLIRRALSPMYLSTMADDTTLRKLASTLLATARARSVLPVPVGRIL